MNRRKNTLNNMSIEVHRRSTTYQAIITDLCLEGIITREKAEVMLGYEIPSFMKGPSGKSLEEAKPVDSGKMTLKKSKAAAAESKEE